MSLKTNKVQLASSPVSSSHPMVESDVPRSNTVLRIPRSTNKVGDGEKESIIYVGVFSVNLLKQESSPSVTVHRLDRSRPASVSKSLRSTIEKSRPLFSRIQKLSKEVSKKRRVATTPIPGPEPTHASHLESIHAARASMLSATNGIAPPRHEMWPLELLDYIKKYKSAANKNPQRDIPRGSVPHSVHPTSPSPHPQQSSVPYHLPRNVHLPQHHMIIELAKFQISTHRIKVTCIMLVSILM